MYVRKRRSVIVQNKTSTTTLVGEMRRCGCNCRDLCNESVPQTVYGVSNEIPFKILHCNCIGLRYLYWYYIS